MNPGLGPGPRPAEGEAAAPPGGQACTLGAVGGALGPQHRRPPGEGRWTGKDGEARSARRALRAPPKSHPQFRRSPDHLLNTHVFVRTPRSQALTQEPGTQTQRGSPQIWRLPSGAYSLSWEAERDQRPKCDGRVLGALREKQGHATSPKGVIWQEEGEARNLPQFPSW